MNRLNRRMYALLLTVTVAATNGAYGMEVEMVQQQDVALSTAWYRKRSTQVMAAVVTGAAIVYTVAAYMNKVSSPVELWKNLFMPTLPPTASQTSSEVPSQNTNLDEITDDSSVDTTITRTTIVAANDGDNNSTADVQNTNDEQSISNVDTSSVVPNEDNNTGDVVTTDKKQTETVIAEGIAFRTPLQKNLLAVSKKIAEFKKQSSNKFRESFDAWNRGE